MWRVWVRRGGVQVLVGETGGKETTGISRRWDMGMWTGLDWPRIEIVGGRL